MTDEELLASLADAVDRTYHHKDDAGLLDEIARRLREQDGERIRVSEDMLHFLRSSQNRVGSESPEILILHPQEPSNG